jgi:DNA replication and repair protein RecF
VQTFGPAGPAVYVAAANIAAQGEFCYARGMLTHLHLESFRNYRKQDFSFNKPTGLTYLVGDNGQGKTNVLEAIYMLALAKSFRQADEENLIRWQQEFGRIQGRFSDGEGGDLQELEIFLGKAPNPRRTFKHNGVKTSATNFVGQVRVVFFHPEDLNVLYLGPDLRRRYLDILIIQKNRAYFAALRRFKRIREQRNALLNSIRDRIAGEEDLEVWDEQMVREAAIIWKERAKALEFIEARLADKYAEISQKKSRLDLKYQNSLGLDYRMMSMTTNLEEILREETWKSRQRDIASGHTQVGPHRDDLEISLEGIPILRHASRGEFRTILLALKLIEMEYFQEDGIRPILLLDDVFSELDYQRQRFLLEKVMDYQTFITTTKDSAVINQEKLPAGNFVEIEKGAAQQN